ncbi:MAG: hypothetical protein ACYDE0_06830 [Acidiferrobacterales bacterium]
MNIIIKTRGSSCAVNYYEYRSGAMLYITIRKYLPTIVVSVLLLFALTWTNVFLEIPIPDNFWIPIMALHFVSQPVLELMTFIGWGRGPYAIMGWFAAAAIVVIPVAVINYLSVRTRPNQDMRKDVTRMQRFAVGLLAFYLIWFALPMHF